MNNLSMLVKLRKVFSQLTLFCLVLLSAMSHASTIIPANSNVKFRSGAGSLNDILIINTRNSSKISFNQLSDFRVDKPLTIYNGATTSDGNHANNAADVIVISGSTIALNSSIEIIGSPADLLIISTGSRNISCTSCSFNNAGRVTLAHATYNNSSSIGNLKSVPSGAISINNLSAPGVLSVEFIADTVNIAGNVNTNLRADIHPEGGMILHEQGSKVVGSGGVNVYSGRSNIQYNNLEIKGMSPAGALNISGNISAATIAITSANHINIPQGTTLSTLSDALSSSSRNGQFYAPLEGIFLSTIKNTNADINIHGNINTDNNISIKSHRNITLSGSSSAISRSIELLSENITTTHGIIQTTKLLSAVEYYRNTGHISAQEVLINATKDIFNSYGGKITSKTVTLSASSGKVVNGSRSMKVNFSNLKNLTLSVDLVAKEWGIASTVNTTGSAPSNLSAHILANEIYIDTKYFENINPYYINRPNTTAWDSGISINNTNSNKVSIQAENVIKIVASQYILNASGIIGLNQQGVFHINTPILSNERYRLTVDTFKFTQLSLSDNRSRHHDIQNRGDVTKVTSYAPPGRIYSFGEFKFNHVNSSSSAEFVNEFSYFEVFEDLYFHKTDVKTIGLETSINITDSNLARIRSCIYFQQCSDDVTVTSTEAETLFSIRGNVYGIDPSTPSESDLTVDNINALDAERELAVKEYLKQFHVGDFRDARYSYVTKSEVLRSNSKYTLYFTVVECRKVNDGIIRDEYCFNKDMTKSVDELIDDVSSNNDYNGSGYTYNQIESAVTAYVAQLPLVPGNYTTALSHTKTVIIFDYDHTTQRITITYNQSVRHFNELLVVGSGPGAKLGGIENVNQKVTVSPLLSALKPFIN